jgi:protein gp37
MSTKIEWADATWNPTTGCTKVSPGCANCYIERQTPMRVAGRKFVRGNIPILLHRERLNAPLRWKSPRRVFVDSMSDLFHEDVPDAFIDQIFAVMAMAPQHSFLVLTKRPARMQKYFAAGARVYQSDLEGRFVPVSGSFWPEGEAACRIIAELARHDAELRGPFPRLPIWPLPNVWLGVTVENQHWADERIPLLLQTPAAVRFLSCEPLLEPVQIVSPITGLQHRMPLTNAALDWVICGGESGPKRRPFDLEWARDLRRQCASAHIPFFMKQLGGPRAGNTLEELPEDLRVREYPVATSAP